MENKKKYQDLVFDRYAIIKTGGKQYQAIEGKTIGIEKLNVPAGSEVIFEEVLLRKENANKIEVGQPFVSKPVKAVVVKHMRGPKITVFKFKRRKSYKVKQGHRQWVTVIRVTAI